MKDEIDEVFTFEPFGDVGAARFRTPAAMWTYLSDNKGALRHDHAGRIIYVNAYKPPDVAAKDKSVRKFVRAIIEGNGGDGAEVKKELVARYKSGKIWWKGELVAKWSDDQAKLELLGAGVNYKDKHEELMRSK